jgi:hypothetical protein
VKTDFDQVFVLESKCDQTHGVTFEYLTSFVRAFNVSLPQQILIALSLIQSIDACSQDEGFTFLKSKFPELTEHVQAKLPPAVLHELLVCLRSYPSLSLSSKQRQAVLEGLQRVYPEAEHVATLRPLLFSVDDAASRRYSV